MERKYYLRGLGIGIVVTAIIMGIALSGDGTMTDKEIIARAKELGMVENTVLSDMNDKNASEQEENEGDEEEQDDLSKSQENAADLYDAGQSGTEQIDTAQTTADKTMNIDDSSITGEDLEEEDHTDTADLQEDSPVSGEQLAAESTEAETTEADKAQEGTAENASERITSAAVKTITINSGDGSHTVAKKLMDVGVVTSVDAFDAFLCEHGYDKRLRTGTFSIPADASDEQIARIVTGAE